ncbi:hypothetical protein BASA81_002297 [Batrachochytrium salamandrivorans]|nr:hypothetical protein BASA81_002297 [Batrachochytrium salamandrivorans]
MAMEAVGGEILVPLGTAVIAPPPTFPPPGLVPPESPSSRRFSFSRRTSERVDSTFSPLHFPEPPSHLVVAHGGDVLDFSPLDESFMSVLQKISRDGQDQQQQQQHYHHQDQQQQHYHHQDQQQQHYHHQDQQQQQHYHHQDHQQQHYHHQDQQHYQPPVHHHHHRQLPLAYQQPPLAYQQPPQYFAPPAGEPAQFSSPSVNRTYPTTADELLASPALFRHQLEFE